MPESWTCWLYFTHGALSQNVNVIIPRGLPGYTWHKNIEDICGIEEEWQMAKLYNFLKNIFALLNILFKALKVVPFILF